MKLLFTAFLLFLSYLCYSQEDEKQSIWPIDSITKEILFTGVIQVPNTPTADLYSRAKLFVADAYKSSKDVTQLNDDATKTILIKPVMNIIYKDFLSNFDQYCSYQVLIECKDNRYRYSISGHTLFKSEKIVFTSKNNYPLDGKKPGSYTKGMWLKLQNGAIQQTNDLIKSLIISMNKVRSDF